MLKSPQTYEECLRFLILYNSEDNSVVNVSKSSTISFGFLYIYCTAHRFSIAVYDVTLLHTNIPNQMLVPQLQSSLYIQIVYEHKLSSHRVHNSFLVKTPFHSSLN